MLHPFMAVLPHYWLETVVVMSSVFLSECICELTNNMRIQFSGEVTPCLCWNVPASPCLYIFRRFSFELFILYTFFFYYNNQRI